MKTRGKGPYLKSFAGPKSLVGVCGLMLSSIVVSASPSPRDPLDPARSALRSLEFSRARQILEPLAPTNADAQYLLALMDLNGIGTVPDRHRARELLEAAAAGGNAPAAFVLAGELARDQNAEPESSRHWLERSAQLGYPRAADVLRSGRTVYAAQFAGALEPALLTAWAIECARRNDAGELRRLGAPAAGARDAFGRTALTHAVEAGSLDAAAELLEAGADPQAVDSYGISALMLAAQRPDTDLIALLLKYGADPHGSDSQGRTALFYAARANRVEPLRALLAAGTAADARDARHYNALDAALAVGASGSAEALRIAGVQASINLTVAQRTNGKFDPAHPGEVYRGWQPLALAVVRDDASSVTQLIDAGADVRQRVPQGDPLLIVAADAHALGSIPILLKHGADPGAAGESGHGILWLAVVRNDIALVRTLLSNGVKPDTHGPAEQSPLLAAVRAGYVDVSIALLGAGARVNVQDELGRTPLMYASADANGQSALLDALLRERAPLEVKDHLGRTALWYASQAGSNAVGPLLAAGADAAVRDSAGLGVLHAAARQSDARVLDLLLHAKVDANARSLHGDTALMLAAQTGNTEAVRLLLSRSPQLDVQNSDGDTALIAAGRAGFTDVCRLLVAAGANRTIRNGTGISAADSADGRGFATLAKAIAGTG